jgi:hypothetical protein
MDLEELKLRALEMGYYLSKARVDTKKIINAYAKLENVETISVFSERVGISVSSCKGVLESIGADITVSGKTIILLPKVKRLPIEAKKEEKEEIIVPAKKK